MPGKNGLRAAADWAEVGGWVDAFATELLPKTQAGTGAYQIENEEQLAWFAYKVNSGQTALWGTMTANIDLTGAAYGGSTAAPLQLSLIHI